MDLGTLGIRLASEARDKFDLIILDSLYKLAPPKCEENSNSDMTQLLLGVDRMAQIHDAAVVFIHHQSKGRQDNKKVTDVGSGAGAISRSSDVHFVLARTRQR